MNIIFENNKGNFTILALLILIMVYLNVTGDGSNHSPNYSIRNVFAEPLPNNIEFSEVIKNKSSFVDRRQYTADDSGQRYLLTFINGLVIQSTDGAVLITGLPVQDILSDNDTIILVNRYLPELKVGQVISVSGPSIEEKQINHDGNTATVLHITSFDDIEITGQLSISDYPQLSNLERAVSQSSPNSPMFTWWLLTNPASPMIGISPLKPINVYPSYP